MAYDKNTTEILQARIEGLEQQLKERDEEILALRSRYARDSAVHRETDDLFRLLLRHTPIYIFFKDENIRPIALSDNYEKMLGMPVQELLGKNMFELFPSDLARSMVEDDKKILREGVPIEVEESLEGRHYTTLKFPIVREGKPRILAGFTIDITERKNAEEHNRRLEKQLHRAQKLESLGLLAGGIAHDFNNLLSGVFGYVDLALDAAETDSPVHDYLKGSLKAFHRARDLTQQLLTFSRGGEPVRKTGVLGNLVTESVGFALSGSAVKAEIDVESDLWTCDYDEGQIGQVIDNIVINAKQAMPTGGTLRVRLRNAVLETSEHAVLPSGRYVEVSIADEGIGMPAKILDRIFEPFFTTKQVGSGLGLATAFSIVQRHGGTIEVESQPGEGSFFRLLIPASDADAAVEDETGEAGVFSLTGRVLLMDDEECVLDIAAKVLESAGCEVVCTRDGDEAARSFRQAQWDDRPFDLAVLDLTVPGGTGGIEAAGQLLRLKPDLPIIASSGYAASSVMSDPTKFGFVAGLRKPYRKSALLESVARFLEAR